MQPRDYLHLARRELANRGVVGARAAGLLEEWRDHLETEIENRTGSGQELEDAGQVACEVLGEPATLAKQAATEVTRGTWQGRHPWLSAGGFASLLLIASTLISAVTGGVLIEYWEHLHPEALPVLVASIGTLPWILGLAWLAWQMRKMPSGWKGFWIVTAIAALVLNLVKFAFVAKSDGQSTVGIGFGFDPRIDILQFFVTFALATIFWWWNTRSSPTDNRAGIEV